MKMRKKISWLLSFFMVFSLFMGSAGMIVKADGQKAVVRIARQDSTATGTVYYKWDTAAEWTEVNQTAYNDTPIEINRPDDSLDHTVHFKVVCGTGTIINHCQVNKNGAQDASLDKNILTSESGQAFSVSTSEQVELILEFRTAASGGSGSTTGPASGETIMLLGFVGKFLGHFPSMRDASDNIRSAMNTCVEFALLIGSTAACCTMGASTSAGAAGGFALGACIYLINEMTGRKIMRMAIGPIAAIATGVILNLTYLIGLTPLV